MNTWPRVKLGEVLNADRRPVAVDPIKHYREIGIRSFGRGIFDKPDITGEALGNKRVFEVIPDRLAFNIVFAWEGAVATTQARHAGAVASHRFPQFAAAECRLDLTFAAYALRSEAGLETLRKASPGSAGRNRTLSLDALLRSEIPLPPIDEQRRIAAWLGSLEDVNTRVPEGHLRDRDSDAYDGAIELAVEQLTDGWERRRIGALALFGPKVLINPTSAAFVPMSAVSESGEINAVDFGAGRSASGYSRFAAGDILYAKITPCMENGKVALVRADLEVGLGSSEFYVLRPHGVDPSWLQMWLRRRAFRAQAKGAFTGTAGQQRVPAAFLSEAEIPVPPDEQALRATLAAVQDLQDDQSRLRAALRRRKNLHDAVLPSALNQVFGS